jgi:CBS domain-containing protein
MKVREIMTTDVRSCGPEASLAEAAMIMWENDCGTVPVVNGAGQAVGIVTDRDICMAVATKNRLASDISVGEVSQGHVRTCRPEADVSAALDVMRKEQLRRLPVVDEGGRLVGILSLADVVRHAKKGESKKARHVPHKEVLRVLKALTRPAPPLEDDVAAEAAEALADEEIAEAATSDV